MDANRIRNFCIIAHIDHGKSTLADRILEITGTVSSRDMTEQFMDQMDLERERGITIKGKAVRMTYANGGGDYQLNLIDTPGHVDFSYEVSRALAACEGALLVVDATQGIQAQTLANVYLALEHDLTIIPVVNKIDLPVARPYGVSEELQQTFGFMEDEVLFVSAKDGRGVGELLETIVKRVSPPQGDAEPLKALIFDSAYDQYKGVVAYVRLFGGSISKGAEVRMMSTGSVCDVLEVGVFHPQLTQVESLHAGEVGYIATGLKNVRECRVGDTITMTRKPATEPMPGYQALKPMVFAGLYPAEGEDYLALRVALEKLQLSDAALSYEPEASAALGFGFRCGFLGLLHMEIVQERLEREYGLEPADHSARRRLPGGAGRWDRVGGGESGKASAGPENRRDAGTHTFPQHRNSGKAHRHCDGTGNVAARGVQAYGVPPGRGFPGGPERPVLGGPGAP